VKGVLVFVLGTLSGVVLAGWYLGMRPAEPPAQVTLLSRPASPPAPAPIVVPVPVPPAAVLDPAPLPAEPVVSVPEQVASKSTPKPAATAEPAIVAMSPSSPPKPGYLVIPVAGVQARQLSDSFSEVHSGQRHEAIDIMAPRGTPVVAVEDGRITKLFTSKPGGLTIYQFDPSEKFAYYYAHLDKYAQGIVEGKHVSRGEVIGYVGSTGNASAEAPHLHFSIFVLGPEKRWWKGTAINPYPVLAAH
jgi:murein DD-endopeptidase MepM/ murein hydrolase activator NlpD